jgi:hypothetical protein
VEVVGTALQRLRRIVRLSDDSTCTVRALIRSWDYIWWES